MYVYVCMYVVCVYVCVCVCVCVCVVCVCVCMCCVCVIAFWLNPQAGELDKIEVSAVQSGVNVKDGNEQVRSVSGRGKSLQNDKKHIPHCRPSRTRLAFGYGYCLFL